MNEREGPRNATAKFLDSGEALGRPSRDRIILIEGCFAALLLFDDRRAGDYCRRAMVLI